MDKHRLTLGMDENTFEQLACSMRRDMFLAGLCLGMGLTGLWFIGAHLFLTIALAGGVVWIAWRGWPWEG